MEKISIVVPIYNVEQYLPRCIESIIKQSYKNLEIILVNDGSTDKSEDICKDYSSKDNRIKVIYKANGGLSDARNVGIENATGQYIGFIDSDDYIEKDMYELLYKLIKDNKSKMVICGMYISTDEEDIVVNKIEEEVLYTSQEAIGEMLKGDKFDTSACDKLYAIDLFDKIRYPKGKLCEDLYTTYKLIHKAKIIAYSSEPKYYYYQRQNSIMNSSFEEKDLDALYALEEMCEFLRENYPALLPLANKRTLITSLSLIKKSFRNDKVNKKAEHYLRELVIQNYTKDIRNMLTIKQKVEIILTRMSVKTYKFLYITMKRE